MYKVVFQGDNGNIFVFGKDGGNVFDMDLGSGVPVELGTSQGFSQVGETVDTQSVNGRTISVKGVIFGDINKNKKAMRKTFAPFASGKLVFQDGYYTQVVVKEPPAFSSIKNDGRFTMLLFAPFPFFYSPNDSYEYVGGLTPMFSFPVNYAVPHKFGERTRGTFVTIYNESDVKVPFTVNIKIDGVSSNPVITNLATFQFLKINGQFKAGETVDIYRDKNNVLRAELTASDGSISDIISLIDEKSTLFELNAGDNMISVNDDQGATGMITSIGYSPVVVALYED